MYDPAEEGKTHINAYSKSKTELGRLLSNFAYSPITLKTDGYFASIEAYWYWLICGPPLYNKPHPRRDELRKISGFRAKQLGRELADGDWREDEEFKQAIKRAIWKKLRTNRTLSDLLRISELPITHYYCFGTPAKVVIPERGQWIWDFYERARVYLKEHPED